MTAALVPSDPFSDLLAAEPAAPTHIKIGYARVVTLPDKWRRFLAAMWRTAGDAGVVVGDRVKFLVRPTVADNLS